MVHEAKDFTHLLGALDGISDAQLNAHFSLYQGYVKKLNEVEDKLMSVDKSAVNYSYGEYSELKRRHVVPFNGAYLHQMYFENLDGDAGEMSDELAKSITESFGSLGAYYDEMKASASSVVGWVITTFNKRDGRMYNFVVYEHHVGLPVDQEIIVVMDCWEHAFMIDYGTKKLQYVEAFLKNVNWEAVNERFAR